MNAEEINLRSWNWFDEFKTKGKIELQFIHECFYLKLKKQESNRFAEF